MIPALAEAAAETAATTTPRVQELDAQGRAYATGRRKDAVARVWIKPGRGVITVNGREFETYFARPVLRMVYPAAVRSCRSRRPVRRVLHVKGGGLSGQAGAVRHGISVRLTFMSQSFVAAQEGRLLTRDSRTVERKKYGRAKARRSFQFSKR